jgi:hypothetical protein
MNPILSIVLSAAVLLLTTVSGAVIDLTDETFEHQTQASTGQVSFFALIIARHHNNISSVSNNV